MECFGLSYGRHYSILWKTLFHSMEDFVLSFEIPYFIFPFTDSFSADMIAFVAPALDST